jgi:hypothetical protein
MIRANRYQKGFNQNSLALTLLRAHCRKVLTSSGDTVDLAEVSLLEAIKTESNLKILVFWTKFKLIPTIYNTEGLTTPPQCLVFMSVTRDVFSDTGLFLTVTSIRHISAMSRVKHIMTSVTLFSKSMFYLFITHYKEIKTNLIHHQIQIYWWF